METQTSLLIVPDHMKTCFKCGQAKPRSEFYRHPQMGDGLLGKCKECTKTDVANRYAVLCLVDPSFIKKERARGRDKYHRLYAPGKLGWRPKPRVGCNWQSPPATKQEKMRAHNMAVRAARSGRIVKPSQCEDCGWEEGRLHAHHEDYRQPLLVVWVCSTCHRRRHATHPERVKTSPGVIQQMQAKADNVVAYG